MFRVRSKYSISEFFSTGFAFLLTKLTFRRARLLRRPIYIRGKKSMGGGIGLTTGHSCRFDLEGRKKTLFIGEHCEMGDYVHIVAYESVTVGDHVLMASKVFISDTSHGNYGGISELPWDSPDSAPNDRELVTNPTRIGDRVWIGENAVILAGSCIGDGCVIGANAVVKGMIEANSIAAGIPAKVVKKWNPCTKAWEPASK